MTRTSMTMLLILILGLTAFVASAPAVKDVPANQVAIDDDEKLTQEQREQVVVGLILQIAREFDDGLISLDELEGRSSARHDDSVKREKDISDVQKKDVDKDTHLQPTSAIS